MQRRWIFIVIAAVIVAPVGVAVWTTYKRKRKFDAVIKEMEGHLQ